LPASLFDGLPLGGAHMFDALALYPELIRPLLLMETTLLHHLPLLHVLLAQLLLLLIGALLWLLVAKIIPAAKRATLSGFNDRFVRRGESGCH
jgi:hypothetical protein